MDSTGGMRHPPTSKPRDLWNTVPRQFTAWHTRQGTKKSQSEIQARTGRKAGLAFENCGCHPPGGV